MSKNHKSNVTDINLLKSQREKSGSYHHIEQTLDCMVAIIEAAYPAAFHNYETKDYLANSMIETVFCGFYHGWRELYENFPWPNDLKQKSQKVNSLIHDFWVLLDGESEKFTKEMQVP